MVGSMHAPQWPKTCDSPSDDAEHHAGCGDRPFDGAVSRAWFARRRPESQHSGVQVSSRTHFCGIRNNATKRDLLSGASQHDLMKPSSSAEIVQFDSNAYLADRGVVAFICNTSLAALLLLVYPIVSACVPCFVIDFLMESVARYGSRGVESM